MTELARIPLHIVPPFDDRHLFERARQTGNRSRLTRLVPSERRFVRAFRTPSGRAVPAAVQFSGDVDTPSAEVILPSDVGEEDAAAIANAAAYMIGAAVDLAPFYDAFAGDAKFAPLLSRLRGSKIFADPDLFECLAKTIISQQLNLAFAGTLIERLAKAAGETVELVDFFDFREFDPRGSVAEGPGDDKDGESGDGTVLAFPGAEAVARLGYDDLRRLSFSQRKAEYVIDAARAVADGTIDFARIANMEDEEAIAELTRFRGIGRWTVECLLIFGCVRPNLLPSADIGLRNAVRNVYKLPGQPSASDVERLGAAWAPWRTYATYYLWESLRLA